MFLLEVTSKTTFGNIIVVSGALIILLFMIKKFAWGNIVEIFEKRAQKISDDISNAEKAKARAEELAKAREIKLAESRNEATEILSKAKESGNISREHIISEAKTEAEQIKNSAHEAIKQERTEAIDSIKDDVCDISVLLASKILGQELSTKAHQDLIDQYIDKLGDVHGQ